MTTAPTAPPARRTTPSIAATEWLAAGGVVAVGVAVAMDPAGIEDGPIICPFRLLTGLPCPGCGLTRSWVYAVHGWWGDSFASHPFGLPLLAFVLVVAGLSIARRVRRRAPISIDALLGSTVAKVVLAGWLGWALVRLVLAF
ncbi:DUF2752 domain-containing protein [Nocardioides zeae]|uniref:DUF2752 domain-containing protein n=1 Tax=Nocardioides imazamoxiresistens TaxID=3231893 RepID=A0ABU3PVX2_9ACTN|nr:DUF2752 domain-containing protein [Nocardioides zeae]MDT9592977.1 DUF2752 domain-containing protein [Nocardioides zeae]